MLEWAGYDNKPGYQEEYLMELIHWKGRGDAIVVGGCSMCSSDSMTYQYEMSLRGFDL